MKLMRIRASTTHVDRHNERFAREALESAAVQATGRYMTVMWNHDIRYPPLGRTTSAQVVPLDDGEYALENIVEIWEEGDTAESLRGDGRSVRTRTDEDHEKFVVRYDRTFSDQYGLSLIHDLAERSGAEPQAEGKKALEPVSALVIEAGPYALGAIAVGFLAALGTDIYNAAKSRIKRFFDGDPSRQVLVDFELVVESKTGRFEVHTLVDNADSRKIESLFSKKFDELDRIVTDVCEKMPDIARVVLDWHEGGIRLRYVVRKDGVPFAPDDSGRLSLDEALARLRDVPAFHHGSIGGGIARADDDSGSIAPSV